MFRYRWNNQDISRGVWCITLCNRYYYDKRCVTANVSGANYTLKFNPDDGVFDYIGANGQDMYF